MPELKPDSCDCESPLVLRYRKDYVTILRDIYNIVFNDHDSLRFSFLPWQWAGWGYYCRHLVMCQFCGHKTKEYKTEARAIEAWNRRQNGA